MNLRKKKALAAKTFGVGLDRIIFNTERLSEIKEALTHQDIKDLLESGAIKLRPGKGRRTKEKNTLRRRAGSVKHKNKPGKSHYVALTRKLRFHLSELKKQNKISNESYVKLRKHIRASMIKSKNHLKEVLLKEK